MKNMYKYELSDYMKMNLVVLPSPYLMDDLVFPNLGILYLSSVLKQNNYETLLIDLHGIKDWQQELIKHIENNVNNIWGISCVTSEFPLAVETLEIIKLNNPRAHVVIGGPMASCDPQKCLSLGFDQVVVGEGENAILKIMEGCRDTILKEALIQNLDDIPFPDRTNTIDKYHYEISDKKSTSMITSRGCYWSKCRFCCQVWDYKIRYRSAENVLKEIKTISDLNFKGIMMVDDEFFSNKDRDYQICKGFKELDISYRCLSRPDLINEEIARIASDTNCNEILLGLESGSTKILKFLNKGMTTGQYKKAINLLQKYNIRVKSLFIIGLPGESEETIKDTVRFIEDAQPDICEFTIYTPYPNSEFWNNSNNYDIYFDKADISNRGQWYKGKIGDYQSCVSTSYLTSQDILQRRDELEKTFGFKH